MKNRFLHRIPTPDAKKDDSHRLRGCDGEGFSHFSKSMDSVDAMQEQTATILERVADHILGLGLYLAVDETQTIHYEVAVSIVLLARDFILFGAYLNYFDIVLEGKGIMYGAT